MDNENLVSIKVGLTAILERGDEEAASNSKDGSRPIWDLGKI